jgi:hypothetical protein
VASHLRHTDAGETLSIWARTGPGSGVTTFAAGVGAAGVGIPAKGFVAAVGIAAAVGSAAGVLSAAVGTTANKIQHSERPSKYLAMLLAR